MSGCEERIDINTDDSPPCPVIYGYITTDVKAHTITITRSSGYFAETPPEGITGANVTIYTDDGINIPLSDKGNGLYQTNDDVCGIEGKTYKLRAEFDFDGDGNKEVYEAESYLPHAAEIYEISLAASAAFKNDIEIQVTGLLPEKQKDDQNYYSMHAYRNGEIVNDDLEKFEITGDKYIKTREVNNLVCFYLDQDEDDSKLNAGDIVTLRIDVITKDYADFISNAQKEVNGSIPMFSGPPANVLSNIKCNNASMSVFGFFTAYSGREKSVRYLP